MIIPNSRIMIIVFAALFVSACERQAEPERALSDFAAAVNERRCGDAMEFLSTRTRYSLDRLREKPQRSHDRVPLEEYYCSKFTFEDCKLRDMSLKNMDAENATVSMPCGRTQDSFLPGFPSMFLKYEPRDWELVREGGQWRIVLPFVIKIVEVREKEDQLREKVLREHEERRKRRKLEEASSNR